MSELGMIELGKVAGKGTAFSRATKAAAVARLQPLGYALSIWTNLPLSSRMPA
jgi:hypothetical protein